ncbi:MAG: hypothetical protein IOC39_01340 [Burkholderia sp.]|uniref:hypothetical protein n=1 Tax=Burkholderia sp. TaxID=36773 RepID=UPI00259121F2|nr:hypothetical protein [Burkholderia sp.]MCA3778597.1 hypothetical protein [Burkholderia sp.]MCA3785789.1 hypothetical protein [Burkholderia sp.]MCA3797291.1 hypothetical protein [Burkholderia sp.]MCA3801669.1 hypothetical protein [Burkholderia sp.]MCA3811607.1 hypothetical protein [Burkholderia sp.]
MVTSPLEATASDARVKRQKMDARRLGIAPNVIVVVDDGGTWDPPVPPQAGTSFRLPIWIVGLVCEWTAQSRRFRFEIVPTVPLKHVRRLAERTRRKPIVPQLFRSGTD